MLLLPFLILLSLSTSIIIEVRLGLDWKLFCAVLYVLRSTGDKQIVCIISFYIVCFVAHIDETPSMSENGQLQEDLMILLQSSRGSWGLLKYLYCRIVV